MLPMINFRESPTGAGFGTTIKVIHVRWMVVSDLENQKETADRVSVF